MHNNGCAQPSHLSSFGSRNLLVHWGLSNNGELTQAANRTLAATKPTLLRAPIPPPCIFFDITHDNDSPIPSRGCGYLANLMTMVSSQPCAAGSTRGVEELISHKISVVDERRLYPTPAVESSSTLWPLRRALSKIRTEMQDSGYDTSHIASVGPLVVVRRLRKHDLSQYVYIIRAHGSDCDSELPPVQLDGSSCNVKFSFNLRKRHSRSSSPPAPTAPQLRGVWGTADALPSVSVLYGAQALPQALGSISCRSSSTQVNLNGQNFVEGCLLVLHISLREEGAAAVQNCSFDNIVQAVHDQIQEADEHEIAYALYCCDPEEHALSSNSRGCYAVDGHKLPFAGIQGFCSVFDEVRMQSRVNMDHPVLQHFQQGLWSVDYIANRLKDTPNLRGLIPFYHQLSADLSQSVPSSHWPHAVDTIFCASANALHTRLLSLCGGHKGDCPRRLVRSLRLFFICTH